MEEQEYRQIYYHLNRYPCAFAKAILSSRCNCMNCQRLNLAEREEITCMTKEAQELCTNALQHFYQNAKFTLKLKNPLPPFPHGKAIKVQCGGLLGLQAVLFPDRKDTLQVEDVYTLIMQALTTFTSVSQFPYQDIIKFVGRYKARTKNITKA